MLCKFDLLAKYRSQWDPSSKSWTINFEDGSKSLNQLRGNKALFTRNEIEILKADEARRY